MAAATEIIEPCKICQSYALDVVAHTARCRSCGVLLFWPYPKSDEALMSAGEAKDWPVESSHWYSETSFLNHSNFTEMVRFAMGEGDRDRELHILDYGGGGGQFALVCKSHFPNAAVYITDIYEGALLDEWRPMNRQIRFSEFADDETKFDVIFLNDVFEHVSDPRAVLSRLAEKLKPHGRIFIDTPKQFWLYPAAKMLSRSLYEKILRGTVSIYHLQIWSKQAFDQVARSSGLKIDKYAETSEYTMPASFYLKNMGITNPFLRILGGLFYRNAKYLAKNKIVCVLTKG